VFPSTGTDAEMFAEIDVIAAQIGVTASDVTEAPAPVRPAKHSSNDSSAR
jgi:hypothetical protein